MFEFISNWWKRSTPITSNDLAKLGEIFGATPSSAGVVVKRETVLGSSAVWRAVNLISSDVGRIPLLTYKDLPDGGRDRYEQHNAYRLLKNRTSPLIPSYQFKKTLTAHALLQGNGYANIIRDFDGNPTELVILDPEQTTAAREDGKLLYVTHIDGRDYRLLPENVLHIRGLGFDGLTGYSVLKILKEAFSTGLALQKYGNIYFRNNAQPSVVIEIPGTLKDIEAVKRLRDSWGSLHKGLDNAHMPAILEGGAKVEKWSVNNEEAQWLQSKEFDLINVSNAIGLPPSKIGSKQNTSYSSLEQDALNYLSDIEPWLHTWESECETKLLTEAEKIKGNVCIEFLREALLKTDKKTELEMMILELTNGGLSWEEFRKIKNRPAEKDEMAEWRHPSNVVIEGEEPVAPQAAPQTPPETSQNAPESTEKPKPEPTPARSESPIVEATVRRLVSRLKKSQKSPVQHRGVFLSSLPGVDAAKIDKFLNDLSEEISASLPEQREAIFNRIDIETLSGDLWN